MYIVGIARDCTYLYIPSKCNSHEFPLQFLHRVTSVKRVDNVWKVQYTFVSTEEKFEEEYDFVFICSGHNSKPNQPVIPHEETFRGKIIILQRVCRLRKNTSRNKMKREDKKSKPFTTTFFSYTLPISANFYHCDFKNNTMSHFEPVSIYCI